MSQQKMNEKPSVKRFKQTTLFFTPINSNVTSSSSNPNSEQPTDTPFIDTFPTNSGEVIVSPFCYAVKNVEATDKDVQLPEIPIFPNDIALALSYKTHITPHKRHELLTQNWSPAEDYIFPTLIEGGQQRRFNVKWLKKFPWLVYSPSKEGAFCKFCALFGPQDVRNQPLKRFVNEPLCRYKDALEQCRNHETTNYHNNSLIRAENFKLCFMNEQMDIIACMDSSYKKQVEDNRRRITPIIKTVIFCGRQELPLRGHRDHGPLLNENSHNDGVFRAALRFRIDAGDSDLEKHVLSASANATYCSWETQNAIIEACGVIITEVIVREVKAAKYFTIIVDETTDCATKEQCSLSLRYVKGCKVVERFLAFCDLCGDQTAKSIAECILEKLVEVGLDPMLIRGQGYDGASAMSGKHCGVQAEIKKLSPSATYIHCASHVLNLAVQNSCSIVAIRNARGQIGEIAKFFNHSAKRTTILQNKIKGQASENNENQMTGSKKLKQICPTRWVESHSAVIKFMKLLYPVVDALNEITLTGNDFSSLASSLLRGICCSDFIVSLVIMEEMSALLLPLSKALQSPTVDLSKCLKMIEEMTVVLKQRRENSSTRFKYLFEKASQIANELDVEVRMPRRVSRQTCRENYDSSTAEDYFRLSLYNPYLDSLVMQLDTRFAPHATIAMKLQLLLPTNLTCTSFTDLQDVVDMYKTDISSTLVLEGEFDRWKHRWTSVAEEQHPKTLSDTLVACDSQCYPNLHTLLRIFLTLPVTSATAERSFSTQRRLLTYLRSTMGEDRLTGLALLSIHRDVEVPVEAIFDELSKKKRRLTFVL